MLKQTCKKRTKKRNSIFGSKGSFYVIRGTAADPQTACGWLKLGMDQDFNPKDQRFDQIIWASPS